MVKSTIPLKSNPWFWGGLVLVTGLIERILLASVYPVREYNDTGAYRRLAESVLNGWSSYDGTRTPGYPVFLAIFGTNEHVYFAQLALGLIMTMLFFWMGWKASGNPIFGAVAGLAHTLNPGQLFFEANLMTENAATFWVVLSSAGAFAWIVFPNMQKWWLAILTGAAAGLAGLTRPLYVPLALWIGFFLAVSPAFSGDGNLGQRFHRITWKAFLGVSLPAIALTGLWMNFLHENYHMWNITTMTGYNLIQHTGYYFEYVPDEYAALRDTYIKYRDERIAEYGTQGNTIWKAIPEMQEVSGLSFYDLSRTLQRLSIQLILEHPDLYFKYVLKGWWLYWRAPVYWSAENLTVPVLAPVLSGIILFERVLIFGANMFFLGSSIAALVSQKLRNLWKITPWMSFLALTIWAFSIVQTLPDHGDNPRFLIPMQSLLIFWVLWIGAQMINQWIDKKKNMTSINPARI